MAIAARYSSLASMSSALIAPVVIFWLTGRPDVAIVIAAMSLLLIARHRANIGNLLAGRERRIGEKAARH
jgi:glycerol-3-phosphate acyltransferase PlsY